jgi:predicted peptidase
LKSAIRLLHEIVDRHPVDRSRVYVVGFSMGGEASWDAITYYPEMFAAALIMNGAGDPRVMARVRNIPIRFFHGDRDSVTPTGNSRELDAALRALGAMARYTELQGVGHDIRRHVCTRENFAWLLQQRRASPAP